MATGDPIGKYFPNNNSPPATNFATFDQDGASPVLDYDDAVNEAAIFFDIMDENYDGSTAFTITIGWKFTTFVGSQTCQWKISIARIDDDNHDYGSLVFAAAVSALATEASADGELDYHTDTMTNAEADGIQPGELFAIKVERDAALGTASPGDAELAFVEIKLQ